MAFSGVADPTRILPTIVQSLVATPIVPQSPHSLSGVQPQDNTGTTLANVIASTVGGGNSASSFAPTGSEAVAPNTPSFAFEQVAAVLQPFDLMSSYQSFVGGLSSAGPHQIGNTSMTRNAMLPIVRTNGLVFPYNPEISEGVRVKYEAVDLTHRNESYHAYKSTDNVRIGLTNCIWTCDTFDNAIYTLAALHFLRRYRFMDFGRGKTGRPPSPMWFRAYGNYAFYKVPVLMEKADWNYPSNSEMDYVGIPEFGRPEFANRQLATTKSASGNYTWLPIKFTASINLIVQHSPAYWTNWSLADYRSGAMLQRDNTFHKTGRSNRAASGNAGQTVLPSRGITRLLNQGPQRINQQAGGLSFVAPPAIFSRTLGQNNNFGVGAINPNRTLAQNNNIGVNINNGLGPR